MRSAVLVDLALAEDLKEHPKVTAIEGSLVDVLPSLPASSLDIVLCLSVLEHLWEPEAASSRSGAFSRREASPLSTFRRGEASFFWRRPRSGSHEPVEEMTTQALLRSA